MSRIGLTPVSIPAGVTVDLNGATVTVKGAKGELLFKVPQGITVDLTDNILRVARQNDENQTKAFHGLTRSLIANMVTGVSTGFTKKLELIGTGYRAKKQANGVTISAGYSHPIQYTAPEGITLDVEGETVVSVSGADRRMVGQVAAEIRSIRPPEPYKGKGIRYAGEVIRRKAGKAAKGAGA